MNQMKNAHGLLYAELIGEIKNRRGTGQTMTVWDGKSMPKFRNKSSHGFAMKFFSRHPPEKIRKLITSRTLLTEKSLLQQRQKTP